jgi:hypothetical protein
LLSKKQITQLENSNPNNFKEDFKEELRDLFEITSYLLSQIETEDNEILYVSQNRGEA